MSWSYETLTRKLTSILTTHGKDVYLRRRCRSCSQSGERSKYDPTCTVCGGKGYVQTIERHTMRKQIVGTQFSWPDSLRVFGAGVILEEGTYFYCLGSVHPVYGDLIYDFNEATSSWECFEINKALERRYDHRVLFYTCAANLKESMS